MSPSGESPLKGEASLLAFAAHRERKQAEEDAIKLQNRIRKLNAEKERAEKLIEQTRRKAEELQKIKARYVCARRARRAPAPRAPAGATAPIGRPFPAVSIAAPRRRPGGGATTRRRGA